MARKELFKQKRQGTPTIIGAGLTERWYFTHLQTMYGLRIKLRPRFFGSETVHSLEKRIAQVLSDEGKAIVVFDADVSTWNDTEKQRLTAFRKKYANNSQVLICDSLPSIEFWFLLHFCQTNRHFGTSKAVIADLKKYINNFDKTETFLKNRKWVEDMSLNGRIEQACQRAKDFGVKGESYSNMWKAIQEFGIVD